MMKVTQQELEVELARFVRALFQPDELVEIRAVQTWLQEGKRVSRLCARFWMQAGEVASRIEELNKLNAMGANIFYGVNPRVELGGKKSSVAICRHLWVDLDQITYDEAKRCWTAHVPEPTLIVNSGHGIHAYWRLREEFSVSDHADRTCFEAMLKAFAAGLGGDATQDVSRLLRLPGFWNVKDLRNGAARMPCRVLLHEPKRSYSIDVFERWQKPLADKPHTSPLAIFTFGANQDQRRIQGLIQYLDRVVEDRSRRDFGVICALLEILPPHAIWPLVKDHSKFSTHGEPYFQVTLANALRTLGT
jgi:hypothetical protein